jgi:lysophospholipase L1-like esterase
VPFPVRPHVAARRALALAVGASLTLAAVASKPPARAQSVATEPPVTPSIDVPPGSFARLHAALARGRARIAFYGASHTAADGYTHRIRERLQRRFGDGGPGLVSVATPFPFHRQQTVRTGPSALVGRRIFGSERRRDDYGPAGFFLEAPPSTDSSMNGSSTNGSSNVAAATAAVEAAVGVRFSRVRVLYRGAAPTVRVDGRALGAALDRDGAEVADGPHRVELDVPVGTRVLGLVLERERGVVVDALGVPGARVADQNLWVTGTLDATLRERPLDLVALAYGTNESANARPPIDVYRRELRAILTQWKRRAPTASCLLIGPGDWPQRRGPRFVPRPRLRAIVEAQREEARAAGCAFFDTFAFMGGDGSMVRWVAEELGDPDHVHFTDAGHRRVGDAIADALLGGMP